MICSREWKQIFNWTWCKSTSKKKGQGGGRWRMLRTGRIIRSCRRDRSCSIGTRRYRREEEDSRSILSWRSKNRIYSASWVKIIYLSQGFRSETQFWLLKLKINSAACLRHNPIESQRILWSWELYTHLISEGLEIRVPMGLAQKGGSYFRRRKSWNTSNSGKRL